MVSEQRLGTQLSLFRPPGEGLSEKWAACGIRKSLATEQVTVVSTWRELVFTKLLRVLI